MPATKHPRTPTYRLHKPSGQAVVTIDGRDMYLGPFRSQISRNKFDRLIAEWLGNGRQLPTAPDGPTINQLILAYWRHAEVYYRKDGEPTKELMRIRVAMRPLKRLYGSESADIFGPLRLKALRREMIGRGLSRVTVNRDIAHIRRMFRWGSRTNSCRPASTTRSKRCPASNAAAVRRVRRSPSSRCQKNTCRPSSRTFRARSRP